MFPSMRRSKQLLPTDTCTAILNEGVYGILGTGGTDGYPYAVPLSYAFNADADVDGGAPSGRLYLHCATSGHKLEALQANPRVSFTVVARSEVAPEKLVNQFRSVIAFGTARQPHSDAEKLEALVALGRKYCPGLDELVTEEIDKALGHTGVIVIDLEAVTGKESLDLAKARAHGEPIA